MIESVYIRATGWFDGLIMLCANLSEYEIRRRAWINATRHSRELCWSTMLEF